MADTEKREEKQYGLRDYLTALGRKAVRDELPEGMELPLSGDDYLSEEADRAFIGLMLLPSPQMLDYYKEAKEQAVKGVRLRQS